MSLEGMWHYVAQVIFSANRCARRGSIPLTTVAMEGTTESRATTHEVVQNEFGRYLKEKNSKCQEQEQEGGVALTESRALPSVTDEFFGIDNRYYLWPALVSKLLALKEVEGAVEIVSRLLALKEVEGSFESTNSTQPELHNLAKHLKDALLFLTDKYPVAVSHAPAVVQAHQFVRVARLSARAKGLLCKKSCDSVAIAVQDASCCRLGSIVGARRRQDLQWVLLTAYGSQGQTFVSQMFNAFHKIFPEECFESRADRRRISGAKPRPAKKTEEEREASRKQRDRARSQDSNRVRVQEKGERGRSPKRAYSGDPQYITLCASRGLAPNGNT